MYSLRQLLIILITWLCCLNICTSQRKDSLAPRKTKNPCIGQSSCGECIAAGNSCAWCQDTNYDAENKERCNLLSDHGSCPQGDIVYPSSSLTKDQDNPTSDGSSTEDPIQIQPQIINLKLRPNDPQRFNLTFRIANNYPLDLYYLMDLSYSMLNDKEKLSTLGQQLANSTSGITSDVRLGFGSFVDKKVMPYVSYTTSSTIKSPCQGCVEAYGFKNHLPLNKDANLFQQKVSESQISGSLDAPEGGMDALMQALVCESDIGWRTLSRRVILYSTDAASHFAGDGKLGGITKPNDGACHMMNNEYTESTNQDYPSVSQIAALVADKSINTIFAVTENQRKTYEQLQRFVLGSVTGKIADDSSNIVDLIRQVYQKISSKVEMVSAGADDVIIRYFSKCLDQNGNVRETNVCESLNIGDSVTFEVEIEVKECPKDLQGTSRTFAIKPVGLSDKLQVRVEFLCKCDCESDEKLNENKQSSQCNNHGTLVCGSCSCDDKYFGKTCNCFTGNITEAESKEQCKASESNKICSDNGECICGTCECQSRSGNSAEKFSGKFCQCDDYSCPFYNNALCGGPEHGKCECGICTCTKNYTGENCECSTDQTGCIDSKGGLCGGKGVCKCNECKCEEGPMYQGTTCEDCMYCDLVCRQNRACVQCVAYGTGELKDDCYDCQRKEYIKVVDNLPEHANSCEFKNENDCIYFFTYSYDENNALKITAKKNPDCPKSVNVVGVVLGVLFSIVIIVLGLLIAWRVFVYIKDKRILASFMLEIQNAEWAKNENPVFNPATRHYKNPMYVKETQKLATGAI